MGNDRLDICGRSFPPRPNVQHVYPINDVFVHDLETREGCVCGARVEYVEGGCVVVHNSMDGRELTDG